MFLQFKKYLGQEVYSDETKDVKKVKKKFVISLQKVLYWNIL